MPTERSILFANYKSDALLTLRCLHELRGIPAVLWQTFGNPETQMGSAGLGGLAHLKCKGSFGLLGGSCLWILA